MEITIPYQEGLLLGRSVDMRTLRPGYMLIREAAVPKPEQVNRCMFQFSFVRSLRDVCDLLTLPEEYALKVMHGQFRNKVVSRLLEGVHLENTFTLVFKASYIQGKQYLPPDAVPKRSHKSEKTPEPFAGNTDAAKEPNCESLIGAAVSSLNLKKEIPTLPDHGTHWVRAVEVGNELIIILRISGPDEDRLNKLFKVLESALTMYRGQLIPNNMPDLVKAAEYVDKKLGNRNYAGFDSSVLYCSYRQLERRPKSVAGLVQVLQTFMDQCTSWARLHNQKEHFDGTVARMSCDQCEGTSRQETAKRCGEDGRPVSYDEDDSFIFIDTIGRKELFHLRVTLKPFQGDDDDVSRDAGLLPDMALAQHPETTYNMFNRIFQFYHGCEEAACRLNNFLWSDRFQLEECTAEANRQLQCIHLNQKPVCDLICGFDLIKVPREQDVAGLLKYDPVEAVNLYIESVMSKLPKGADLDLLMIGKTGHGKSATGNSILGLNRFRESASSTSVTEHTTVEWAHVDGRIIKVVDTPGVCDTKHESDQSSIDVGINSISEAIANCPLGFHALLLVIGFGTRITLEERKAIGLLKCILGEDVIKNHTICVITFGDRFRQEMQVEGKTFRKWCRTESGFLKELFEECNYRCVLFDNKTRDQKQRKGQLISLVNKIDHLGAHGKRYTNSLFEFAQIQRSLVLEREKAPLASEEMVRDMQLLLQHLGEVVDATGEPELENDLSLLQSKVDSFNNYLAEADTRYMATLVDTVCLLAQTIHAKIDEIADRKVLVRPCELNDGKPISEAKHQTDDLKRGKEELENYYNEKVKSKSDEVVQEVTRNVSLKVKAEKQCFPGDAQVCLAEGRCVQLQDVKVGDRLLAVNGSGQLVYDTVYMFGHHEPEAWGCFVVLTTDKRSVAVTSDHYVFCVKDGEKMCVPAGEMKPGDMLCVTEDFGQANSEPTSSLTSEKVTKVSWESKRGLFAPFTESGTLLVDGALMSCYINVLGASTCHALLWPVRQLYRVSPATLGAINGSSSQKPVPGWARAMLSLM